MAVSMPTIRQSVACRRKTTWIRMDCHCRRPIWTICCKSTLTAGSPKYLASGNTSRNSEIACPGPSVVRQTPSSDACERRDSNRSASLRVFLAHLKFARLVFLFDIVSRLHVCADASRRPHPSSCCISYPHFKPDPRLLGRLGRMGSRRHGFLYLCARARPVLARTSPAFRLSRDQRQYRSLRWAFVRPFPGRMGARVSLGSDWRQVRARAHAHAHHRLVFPVHILERAGDKHLATS